jgi:2-polyprenyl-6-hydroxyphenyl methylase/3-demethylubiquinone-9 3-methyltransferase
MHYNPLTRRFWLNADTGINYLMGCRRAA